MTHIITIIAAILIANILYGTEKHKKNKMTQIAFVIIFSILSIIMITLFI